MKRLQKIISAILGVVMCCSVVACSDKTDRTESPVPIKPMEQPSEHFANEGLHEVSIVPTNKVFIASDGTTDYKIVYPKNAHEYVVSAANALVRNIALAVDADIEAVEETNEAWSENAKYIVLGDCKLFEAAELELPEELNSTGCYIKTAGNSVFINAKGAYGVNNGVMVFMEHVLGHDFLYKDMTVFTVKPGDAVTLPQMTVVENPDFEFSSYSANMTVEAVHANRLSGDEAFMPIKGSGDTTWHNSFVWYDDATRAEHRDWVSEDGTQLCYTAHGNKNGELDKMIQHGVDFIMPNIEANPTFDNITFTHQDRQSWCTCDACLAEKQKYGTDSAVCIKFVNKLAQAINKRLADNTPEGETPRTIKLFFFGYQPTAAPPVKYENGKPVPYDGEVKCDPNVGVIIAPIEAKYTHTFYEEENKYSYDNLTAWGSVADTTACWLYGTDFSYYLYPYNCYDTIPDNLRLCKNINAQWIAVQGMPTGASHFTTYKDYLTYKLYWNVNSDVNAIKTKFFKEYYREAEPYMSAFYTEMAAHCRFIENNFDELGGTIYEQIEESKYWPQGLLERWVGYCNEGLKAIEKYKDVDNEMYEMLVKHVKVESMFPRYALIRLYPAMFGNDALTAMKADWKRDAQKYNFTTHAEHYTIDAVIGNW